MPFHPAEYVGRGVPQLLEDLARVDAPELWADLQGLVELHSPTDATEAFDAEAVTRRPSTLLASTVADADLPPDHPEVDVPGVVLETFLAGGGQGWVYTGRVLATNHVVAVKVLRNDHEAMLGAAAREALLCARVRHRNILRVFQAQPAGPFWVVIMELVQGQELTADALTLPQLKKCLAALADALAELRRKGIVHCDVKPANILLRHDLSPVLVDFGVARDLTAEQQFEGIYGTPYFMAPEAFRGIRPHPAWDAYSLGVTTAVLLLGRRGDYETLGAIHTAKVSGKFDQSLGQALDQVSDAELRDLIAGLIGAQLDTRLAALERARHWLAA